MPLTNEGLKVKEELSASLRDGRYLCLNGKLAIPPLGAEPSASSSPHPSSAIRGLSADHRCPQNTYSLGSWQRSEEEGRLFGEGLALAAKLPPVQGHPGEGSHPRPCARPTLCQTPVAPRAAGCVYTPSWQLKLMSAEGKSWHSCTGPSGPLSEYKAGAGRGVSMSTGLFGRSSLLSVLLSHLL